MRQILILIALAISLSACGLSGAQGAFDPAGIIDLPTDTQDAVQIGNPNEPMPAPGTTKSAVAAYLEKNNRWAGVSHENGEAVSFFCQFDVAAMNANISKAGDSEIFTIAFQINDDGSIVTTEEAAEYKISSSAVKNKDSISIDLSLKDAADTILAILNIYSGEIDTTEDIDSQNQNQFGGIGASCMDGHCTNGIED